MNTKLTAMNNNKSITTKNNNTLIDIIINDPESRMRLRIKEIDEIVSEESKKRKHNAPLTVEEKVLLNF